MKEEHNKEYKKKRLKKYIQISNNKCNYKQKDDRGKKVERKQENISNYN